MAAVPSFRLVFGDSKLTGRGVLSTCVILRLPLRLRSGQATPRLDCRCVRGSWSRRRTPKDPLPTCRKGRGLIFSVHFPHPFRPVGGGSFGVLRRGTGLEQASTVGPRLRQPQDDSETLGRKPLNG